MTNHSTLISYLQRFLNNNKARGMAAEMALETDIDSWDAAKAKLTAGAWILSPKYDYHLRVASFTLPKCYTSPEQVREAIADLTTSRLWQTLATFLQQNAVGVTVSGGWTAMPEQFDRLAWIHFVYADETFIEQTGDLPFSAWTHKGSGRPSKGKAWDDDVLERYQVASGDTLTELVMRQAFLEGHLKQRLKKVFGETYDVDGFIVAYSGRVFPLEVKEKSATPDSQFGVDAGRILMLLRFCLITDSNALYIIREVDNTPTRQLVGWRYITLSDLILYCRWNLQGGGRGMGGGSTQTIMLDADLFKPLDQSVFTETWLADHASLAAATQQTAHGFVEDLAGYLQKH
jgi:hypothetical protein